MTAETPIQPVILCGGSGTRLWPISRQSYPKQFVDFGDADTLLQATAKRFDGPAFLPPQFVTGEAFRFIVRDQAQAAGVVDPSILIEPEAKNTAPAILAAAMRAAAQDPETLILVAPSDHAMPDPETFAGAVAAGRAAAEAGNIVCFGIRPDQPETGYGYIELPEVVDQDAPAAVSLKAFVEKPDADTAQRMLDAGRYLWNAGIFLFKARTMVEAAAAQAPDLGPLVVQALDGATQDGGFLRLDAAPWSQLRSVSVDYAIMEHATNLSVVPYGGDWSDLGNWNSIWQRSAPDERGLALQGGATAIDCTDSYLSAPEDGLELVGLGLNGIVAVAMGDSVLVADKARTQEVSKAVTRLKEKNAPQATRSRRDHRPWGWFDVLALGERFQVKRIVVKPGAKLSLQSHVHRSEHWIVVSGTARVTVDDTVRLVSETESIHVPLGAIHRMENPGRVPMVLIEVQTGPYLGEDDIIRYEDDYRRQ